ncbi:MAG: aminoacetone oxidase family FAD-binding enzyme, partial [Lachnospiraceae bacterium]|nr:aminoacetone oxidase family FAD-binding enzyme [Lachnospiraceae bacterium]
GADGDTWKFADELNINTNEAEPSLVPLVTKEDFVKELQGLSLKNVSVNLTDWGKKLYSGFGEMLFTHFGVSGPLTLSASTHVREKDYSKNLKLVIDLKPAMSEKELDERILRDFKENSNKQFINSLSGLLPSKLIPVIVKLSKIDARKQVNIITKEERLRLVSLLKGLELTVTGNRGFNEAIITRGGICVKEINPSTMESKKYKGLFFAGEMIDVDALTGGFNLQIAWSTGFLSGQNE